MHYHQGQSTLPRLATLLRSLGVSISKRQVQRLLTEKHDDFLAEAQDVLRAGLETAPFVSAGMPGRMDFARKSAMTGSHGSARGHRKAG